MPIAFKAGVCLVEYVSSLFIVLCHYPQLFLKGTLLVSVGLKTISWRQSRS